VSRWKGDKVPVIDREWMVKKTMFVLALMAVLGIALILAGVLILNLLSRSMAH